MLIDIYQLFWRYLIESNGYLLDSGRGLSDSGRYLKDSDRYLVVSSIHLPESGGIDSGRYLQDFGRYPRDCGRYLVDFGVYDAEKKGKTLRSFQQKQINKNERYAIIRVIPKNKHERTICHHSGHSNKKTDPVVWSTPGFGNSSCRVSVQQR